MAAMRRSERRKSQDTIKPAKATVETGQRSAAKAFGLGDISMPHSLIFRSNCLIISKNASALPFASSTG